MRVLLLLTAITRGLEPLILHSALQGLPDITEFDPMRALEREIRYLKMKLYRASTNEEGPEETDENIIQQAIENAAKSSDEAQAFAAEAVQLAELVYDLNVSDPEILVPIKRIVAGLIDGVLVVSASSKLSLENIRRRIFKDRENVKPESLIRTQLTDEVNAANGMIKYVDKVLSDASLATETFAVFSEGFVSSKTLEESPQVKRFRIATSVIKSISTDPNAGTLELIGLQQRLRELRRVIPEIKQSFSKAQRVMAIQRLKIARWVYMAVSFGLLFVSPVMILLKHPDIRIFAFVVLAVIAFMSGVASALCFRKYNRVVNDLEDSLYHNT